MKPEPSAMQSPSFADSLRGSPHVLNPAGNGEASEKALQVEYTLTIQDQVEFNLYHRTYSATGLRNQRITFYLVPVMTLCVGALISSMTRDWAGLSHLLPVGIIWLAFVPLYWRMSARRDILHGLRKTPDPTLDKRCLVCIGPEGLKVEREEHASRLPWSGVRAIIRTDKYAYFYTSDLSALILPRTAFPDVEDFDRFVEAARRYHS